MKNLSLLIVIGMLLLTGCKEGKRPLEELDHLTRFSLEGVPQIELQKDPSFSVGSYQTINNIGDLAVDDKGNVYVVNVFKKRIECFQSNGTFLGSIGKGGNDQGEFQGPGNIFIRKDRLYAYDKNLYRIYSFSLEDHKLLRSTILKPSAQTSLADSLVNARPFSIEALNDGNFLVAYQVVNAPDDRTLYYYKADDSGRIISEQILTHNNKSLHIDRTPNKTVYVMMPFERETLTATDGHGNIFTLKTEDLLIKKFDSNGVYLQAYYYPFENKKLNEGEVVNLFTNVDERRAVRGADLPETWPAAARMLIDDQDRLWVATITHDLNSYRWYVLNPTGEVLGRIDLPRREKLMVVKKGYAYIKAFNSRQYSDEVKKFKIKF